MKTNLFGKNKAAAKPLRYRLTASFIALTVVLMGVLWLMQAVFLFKYYEFAMDRKVKSSMSVVESVYKRGDALTYNDFCDLLGSVSSDADVMFYVAADDESFVISSAEQTAGGRIFPNSMALVKQTIEKMSKDGTSNTEKSFDSPMGAGKTMIYARHITPENRTGIYLIAIASLTPLGPAVGIIRSQLLIITAVAIIMGFFVARWLTKRIATPIIGMSSQAKELAEGNYDIVFDGGGTIKEVEELAETLTDTAAELKKSDSLQKDLMANVSHDLRTPLTMIKSYAEMIRDLSGDDPAKRDEHLGVIIDETDRLSDLVNDVLALSKMQAGVTELDMQSFDIQKSAESVLSTFMVMEQEGYTFRFESLPGEIMVNGDEHKLKQVIANLLSNAVHYSSDVKEISLSFEENGDKVRCSVADKGCGIAEEDLDKIWHRYERASQRGARSSKGGTGLGLSIAAEILERHNAKYGVTSKLGEGSTFWFEVSKS